MDGRNRSRAHGSRRSRLGELIGAVRDRVPLPDLDHRTDRRAFLAAAVRLSPAALLLAAPPAVRAALRMGLGDDAPDAARELSELGQTVGMGPRRVSLEELDHPAFARHVGEPFGVRLDGLALDATLEEAVSFRAAGASPMQGAGGCGDCFSVAFRASPAEPLEQGTYTFEHDRMGTFDLFVVPSAPDRDGQRFTAIFNRI